MAGISPAVGIVLWLGLLAVVGWVGTDAAHRDRNWLGWAALVAFTGVLGLIAWLIARRRAPVVVEHFGVWRSLWLRLVAIPLLLLSGMIAVFIVTFLFQVARVEGRAMAPTIADQDRVVVNKLAYQIGEPRVGHIVMLYYPLNPEKSFVKRVIAEEGDQVRVVKGRVYRNDVPMDESFVPAEYRSHDNWGPQVVSEGYYFVMGDHRNNSSDSRHWGFVPKKYIVGRVQWRWWPVSAARRF